MILRINGTDYSSYIQQKTDITETPRRITGTAGFTALSGRINEDYIITKYDPSFRLKPLPREKVAALIAEFENPYVSVFYTSVFVETGVRRIQAVPTASTIKYLCDYAGGRVYGDVVISFTER